MMMCTLYYLMDSLCCRVRPVGSSSETDALDLDRMKQVHMHMVLHRECNTPAALHFQFVFSRNFNPMTL